MTMTANNVQAAEPTSEARGLISIARLRHVPVLASLKEADLHCLVGAQDRHLAPNELLVRQGELTHTYWILLEGSINVTAEGLEGREQSFHVHERGSAFGEVPLLAGIPSTANLSALTSCDLLELDEQQFWSLITQCPQVRKEILGNLAVRLAKMQSMSFHQEKMAMLGTMAAGLMHELNNPGTAARRASAQLRENLLRMHELTARFSRTTLSDEQKECMFELQDLALKAEPKPVFSSLDQADAEESLLQWMEAARIEDAWKLAPTFVSIGLNAEALECAKYTFDGPVFSDALSWLEALVSSMQLVGTIEESIGRVTDLVKAVKSYAYEGRGGKQQLNLNNSIDATIVILGHKLREKEITIDKDFAADLPSLELPCPGLNQIWTNLLDNAVDAAPQHGRVGVKTWVEKVADVHGQDHSVVCVMVRDNGSGIPVDCQPHIFDPFFTTKEAGVGTGLGLGIVHRIVEQCGGAIHFGSTEGETAFVVRLPGKAS